VLGSNNKHNCRQVRAVTICSRDDSALQTALHLLDLGAATATLNTKASAPDLAAAASLIEKAVDSMADTTVCRLCKQNPKVKGLYGFCSSECRELKKAQTR
jgi:hypothetical protein